MDNNLAVPEKIGRYEIRGQLGTGAMAVVYHGYDPMTDSEVAIKVAKPQALNNAKQLEYYRKIFYNEARLAGRLTHPHILKVYDATLDGDILFIVMELVQGGQTLEKYTHKDTLLPLAQFAEVVFKCAKALDYAHRQGVIHRDIKPSNILVDSRLEVKIGDFSISYFNDTKEPATQNTDLVGSPLYMSPEQLRQVPASGQSDIFSLGLVMYELLTGRHPFVAKEFPQIMNKILNEQHQPISHYRLDSPDFLGKIIDHALQKHPKNRYKNAIDLAADLSLLSDQISQQAVDQQVATKEHLLTLQALDFFQDFTEPEIQEVLQASCWQNYSDGAFIITEGDVDDSFYILIEGAVVVTKGERTISTLNQGDCFGEMGYVAKTKRTATICAQGPVSLLKVKSTLMGQASVECQLKFNKVFLITLTKRLSHANEKLLG